MPLVDLMVNLIFAGVVVGSVAAAPVWCGMRGVRWLRQHRGATHAGPTHAGGGTATNR